jgi:hypothetical protein
MRVSFGNRTGGIGTGLTSRLGRELGKTRGRLGAVIAAAVVGLASLTVMPGLAPEPDPIAKRWELDIRPGALRMASVPDPAGNPRLYFFLTYRVGNNTKQDLLFAPAFELSTEDVSAVRSGRDVSAGVTREILERLDNPMVKDQISILGNLLQGVENSKDGVVIWPAPELHPNEITVYAAGFSGETRTIEVADTSPDAKPGAKKQIVLRKTLMLRYRNLGEIRDRGAEPFELVERRWILR